MIATQTEPGSRISNRPPARRTASASLVQADAPYVGLRPLEARDGVAFARRDRELRDCLDLFSVSDRRVMMIHGASGCGKTSFLRAALLPALEACAPELFCLRDESTTSAPLLLRSSADPLRRLLVHLNPKLREEDHSGDPARTLDQLQGRSLRLQRTLVVLLDQVEEVFTLQQEEGPLRRLCAFLSLYTRSFSNCRLLLSMRSEFVGSLRTQLERLEGVDSRHILSYELSGPDPIMLIHAIERPSLERRFGFGYDADLPAQIARQLLATFPQGGAFPVMQVLCQRLYDHARPALGGAAARILITREHYQALTRLSVDEANPDTIRQRLLQQIDAYIDEALADATTAPLTAVEQQRWRGLLLAMRNHQASNGTSYACGRTLERLQAAYRQRWSEEPLAGLLQRTLDALCCQKRPLLRQLSDGSYTLSHDVLALGLQRWDERSSHRVEPVLPAAPRWPREVLAALRWLSVVLAALALAALSATLAWSRWRESSEEVQRGRCQHHDVDACRSLQQLLLARCEGQGDAVACLQAGEATPESAWEERVRLLDKACEGKQPLGCYRVGHALLDSAPPQERALRRPQALAALNRACAEGVGMACFRVALQDAPSGAVKLEKLQAACERGSAAACSLAARRSEESGDFLRAYERYERACHLGAAASCYQMATYLLPETNKMQAGGTKRVARVDTARADQLLASACEQGIAESCLEAVRVSRQAEPPIPTDLPR